MHEIWKTAANAFVTALGEGLPPSVYAALGREVSKITGLEVKDYPSKQPFEIDLLHPLFEWLDRSEADPAKPAHAYPLAPLTAETLFPQYIGADNGASLKRAADAHFDQMLAALKRLECDQAPSHLWLENFDSLMMLYLSCLPAPQNGRADRGDVSLYDYARIRAAFAAVDALYQTQTPRPGSANPYLVISGGVAGIQTFILQGYGEARKYRSKLLRGRSFAVSLLAELCADWLCRESGLPGLAVILNAAGRFTLLAPNTVQARETVKRISAEVNHWLIEKTYGETNIMLACVSAGRRSFEGQGLRDLWNRLERRKEEGKFQKIDLNTDGGKVEGYLESFDGRFDPALCPICRKRPSQMDFHDKTCCRLCWDHIFLGEQLVKKNPSLAVIDAQKVDKYGLRGLHAPLFDRYQIVFDKHKVDKLIEQDAAKVLRYWDLSIRPDGGRAVKFINGYVPVCTPAELKYRVYFSEEESDLIRDEQPQTLNLIAFQAKEEIPEKDGEFQGTEALGVLKADVDDLGRLMACGLGTEKFTLARLATFSRQMHAYFSVYLPHLLEHQFKGRFHTVYTVFAGGDDLFLIGPWNRIIELAARLRQTFARYVCRNDHIHFSAGVSLHKPHTPIDLMADIAEEELEKAKRADKSEKNRITLFGETVAWDQLETLEGVSGGPADTLNAIKTQLEAWIADEDVGMNSAMLFRLNDLMAMADKERRLKAAAAFEFTDMSCAKWRSMTYYTVARNLCKNIRNEGERRKAQENIISKLYQWLDAHGGKLKIPVWQILYNQRKTVHSPRPRRRVGV